jgi:hypothetical protein
VIREEEQEREQERKTVYKKEKESVCTVLRNPYNI